MPPAIMGQIVTKRMIFAPSGINSAASGRRQGCAFHPGLTSDERTKASPGTCALDIKT